MLNSTKTARAIATAIKLARLAAGSTGAEAEAATAKLIALCDANSLNIADIIATAAQPDTGRTPLDMQAKAARATKPEAAPKPKAAPKSDAKPDAAAKPSKPHATSANSDYDKRVALVAELRGVASTLYNGPSLAVRGNPKRIASAVYSDLFATPKHRTTLAKISVRDESFLFTVITRGSKAGGFDPVALNLDSGIFSRLCSVGFILADGDGYKLSPDALAHAKRAAKSAA